MSPTSIPTCPEWCNSELHHSYLEDDENIAVHTKSFGNGLAMGNDDGSSAVILQVCIETAGNIIRDPSGSPRIDVEWHQQETVAQARALAAAILEAADFWEKAGY